jgi:double-stranded uracil-DNA glycosylase
MPTKPRRSLLKKAQPAGNNRFLVPEALVAGLTLVFCGTAPSRASAAAGAYYAHPGNAFSPTLHRVGLTDRLFLPQQYLLLPGYGIGLTDLCKTHSGNDSELQSDDFDVPGFWARIALVQPRIVAFTSMTAGRIALGRSVKTGWQTARDAHPCVYVCCSTSGQARRFWDEGCWQNLAIMYHDFRAGKCLASPDVCG